MTATGKQQKTLMTVLHQKKQKQVCSQFHLLYPWKTNNTLNKD